ncbi:GGDEF domain-containing protein [Undibacter mobilis]|uniref:diguanylate cyclase n=1 Tax=Undibacter mobilis TaxID=2292256 RepID=A0A371B188_9BRAD|nr:GGDEF domain-containing protein [Undibacter mobilis]RDV01310.1 GGDEF domain-containing protein [Undibacter mobilis]
MRLDIPTLAIVTVFVTALLGALLVFAGLQNRAVRALMTWGGAFVLCALGVALVAMRGMVPDWLSIQFANVVVLVGIGLVWVGARQFDGRPARVAMVAVAPLLWLAACAVPDIRFDINLRTVTVSILSALIALAAAYEVWRGRSEPLLSRWPAAITLFVYGAVMLMRVPVTLLVPQPAGEYQFTASALYPLLSFATLLFSVVVAFLLLNMTKERTELRHLTASMVDPLTGVSNRRAFLTGAERLAAQPRADGVALAVMLFDLDHFKAINDRLGHAAGDAVLVSFAAAATRALGPEALFGRIGGEEFGAVMRVAGLGEALAIGEQVRLAFAAAGQAAEIVPTVSVGVAIENDTTKTLEALMAAADRALYRAKAKGRNRVAGAADGVSVMPAESGERRTWRQMPATA